MAFITLSSDSDYTLREHKGLAKFSGCQCFKDCSCKEEYVPVAYWYFTVKNTKSKKRQKTTKHSTLEEAQERIALIKSI